jgi:cobalt/nickel transport system ATP-binding protein
LNLDWPPDQVRASVAEALDLVGMTGSESRVPFHLSGGEKRRVALAGVLAMRPEVLLLDEPTNHLDPRGRREFIRLLHSVRATKIIASHDLELLIETCSRAILLDRGRIMADGPVRSILGNKVTMDNHGLEVPHSLSYHHDRHHPLPDDIR